MFKVQLSDRVNNLPPYLFADIDKMKQDALSKGIDLIDLSIGDPDMPTPAHIVNAIKVSVENPANHKYPSYIGMSSFRQAVADWYKKRFTVTLDSKREVISLIGSKEGIGHIPLSFVNSGDVVLVSSPGYPVYPVGTMLADGQPYIMPLTEENQFLPDLEAIPKDILKKSKLMFINYPNNPTSAVASKEFFKRVIDLAFEYNIIICHDEAYSEIYYDGQRPISFLEVDGAMGVGIEFHSLSKTYNMTGWRLGFAVGNSEVIAGLGKIKTNLDSGVFQSVQEAGIVALQTEEKILDGIRDTYQSRRDVLYEGLENLGFKMWKPKATFYLWTKIPDNSNSTDFVKLLLDKAGVLCTPGVGFGSPGEGYIRFALTQDIKRIKEAVQRIKIVISKI